MTADSPKPVLVFGANSFIARYFLRRGGAVGYSRSGQRCVDVTDFDSVVGVLQSERPDVVLNFATYGNLRGQRDTEEIWQVNVVGTRNLVEALRRVAPETVYLQIGSYSEYGLSDRPMREDQTCAPISPYGIAKLLATELVLGYCRVNGLKAVVLRVSSVYGPGEQPERLFPTLFRKQQAGESFEMWNGNVGRDFTWVGDVCDILWRFVANGGYGRFGEVFNLSRGRQTRLVDVVEAFRTVVGPLAVIDSRRSPELTDSPLWQGDISKLLRVMGGFEFACVETGLRRWCDEQR